MTDTQQQIEAFLEGTPHAVVGASRDRAKYGNKVFRAWLQNNRRVYPVNPGAGPVEGHESFPDLASLPEPVHGISVITPPAVTESIIRQAGQLGIQHVWLQPGAESDAALKLASQLGMNLIAGGPCAWWRSVTGNRGPENPVAGMCRPTRTERSPWCAPADPQPWTATRRSAGPWTCSGSVAMKPPD